jgi:hypothetical protein
MSVLITIPIRLLTWLGIFHPKPNSQLTVESTCQIIPAPARITDEQIKRWMFHLQRRWTPFLQWQWYIQGRWVYIEIQPPTPGYLPGLRRWLGGNSIIRNNRLIYTLPAT